MLVAMLLRVCVVLGVLVIVTAFSSVGSTLALPAQVATMRARSRPGRDGSPALTGARSVPSPEILSSLPGATLAALDDSLRE